MGTIYLFTLKGLDMETSTIIALVISFLVFITFVRRQMLKEKVKPPERRLANRRYDKRRAHTGRRMHEYHADCETKNRRENEDRRRGKKERRHKQRRRHSQLKAA